MLGACGTGVEALYYMWSLASGLEFETDMRWFVEVSRVGESGVADEYCVEAKQWQGALQEARKLRGDLGALSKFSIELLDQGYRAVDPALKLRYLINEAPADAPLTDSAEYAKKHADKEHASKPEHGSRPRLGESVAPSVYATSLAPTPFTTSLAPPANPSAVPRPTSSLAPRTSSVTPPRVVHSEPPRAVLSEPPRAVLSDPPRAAQLVVPDDPIPPAPPLPGGLSLASQPAPPPSPPIPQFELVRQRAEEPRPDSPITYREFAYAVEPGRTRGEVEALLLDRYQATRAAIEDRPPGKFVQLAVFDHVFKRRPERPPLATFAWKDWRGEPVLAFPGFGEEAMGPLSRVPPAPESVPPSNGVPATARSSVAPESTPLVPLAPVVITSIPPAPKAEPAPVAAAKVPSVEAVPTLDARVASAEAPATPSVDVEFPIVETASAPSSVDVEIPIVEAASAPSVDVEIPIVEAASAPSVAGDEAPVQIVEGARAPVVEGLDEAPTSEPEPSLETPFLLVAGTRAPVVESPAPPLSEESAQPAEAKAAAEASSPAAAPSFELQFETPLAAAPAPALTPVTGNAVASERGSRPRIAVEGRRRAGEDLIGELFEIMHDLHFARDVAEGAEFVLSVLDELLPCEGVLIHVFDINTGHFVVVRAKGPHAKSVLLQRMSDQDPLVRSVMRSAHALSVKNAAEDPRFSGSRWQTLGVTPHAVLCGGAQLGGRYLGLIEIGNPHGDIPFHQSELHALDYICEQFAAFLSKKPIVLSADVVLSPV
ncbi:MAG TPA: hypothetical protein VFK05_14495 [Polyangiaceae bacterium]|nr:hypothetical protein [Polyangiaceae bacterium]